MFTGFASENTPAIQVWDFFRTFASTNAVRSVSLADDCAPIQLFRTGATTTAIRVYLPTAPIEGKQINIVNQRFGSTEQKIEICSSDVNGGGTSFSLFTLGQADSIILVYSKQLISYGTSTGNLPSGWISLNKTTSVSANYFSAVVGGDNNSAQQAYSFIGGGSGNLANGIYSSVLGSSFSTASGSNAAVVGGSSNTASNTNAAVVGGQNNLASGQDSAVIAGGLGTTRVIVGNLVFPASSQPISGSVGVTQSALLLLGRQTTNATATVLTSNSSAAGTNNQVILPNNSAYYFKGSCISNVTGGVNTKAWTFEGAIERGANAASTTIVGTVIKNVIAADAGAATWDIAITADTTNGGLAVTVTGAAATTIRWVCKIETTEVTF
jgi:hypothetical protein